MAAPEGAPTFLVGRIARAVGLRGEVEVAVVSDAPDRFASGSELLLGDDLRPATIRSSRTHNDQTIIALAGIEDRTGAESLRGLGLFIATDAARRLDAGEFWDHDLIGCTVVTTSGRVLGEVSDVLHQPAAELLVVGEHLIPLIKDVIREVVPQDRITIEPLPGLLD